ncbi:MAG: DEAD/DEAH box helicase [Erysipelotrichaceae bacterium]
MEKFKEFKLSENINKAINKLGFVEPTAVQQKVIPILSESEDIIVQAQTGSGKTLSYGIPLCMDMVWEQNEASALILVPTRELANQVRKDIDAIATYERFRLVSVYGHASYDAQRQQLKGKVHGVIGTPGRVLDHIIQGTFNLDNIRYVVLDEADEMLDMGFIEQVEEILSYIKTEHTTALFSATMPEKIKALALTFLDHPKTLSIRDENKVESRIKIDSYEVEEEDKLDILYKVLLSEKPDSAIIFAKTQDRVDQVFNFLNRNGMCVGILHGGMDQKSRTASIERFKAGKKRILVATDVAARGLDVDDVTHIINYDLPNVVENYIHRMGRSARKDTYGKLISLIGYGDRDERYKIEESTGIPFEFKDTATIRIKDEEAALETLSKIFALRNDKTDLVKKDVTTLYVNAGKIKKMRAKDIVGAIMDCPNIAFEDIGIIDIRDNVTYVDIHNGKGQRVLKYLEKNSIKGKTVRVEIATGSKSQY